jgi:uncharacterized protein YbaR (Trm112 family)
MTDRLTCPRCGPGFGLVLRADRIEERRVLEGWLGCSNCRDRFPIRNGFGDLRAPPRRPFADATEGDGGPDDERPAPDADDARVLAAALGLGDGGGTTLLVGDAVRFAAPLVGLLPEIEVAALDPRTRDWPEAAGVSRLTTEQGLPFFAGTLRGVALAGPRPAPRTLEEAVRVLAPGHRVVVLDPSPEVAPMMQRAGLGRLVEGSGLVAAGR